MNTLKRFFRTGVVAEADPEPMLKDLCVVKRNGWSPKVGLMSAAFRGLELRQEHVQLTILRAMYSEIFFGNGFVPF